MDKTIGSFFAEIRRDYFPRWRGGASWKIRHGQHSRWTTEHGYCDIKRRRIWLSSYDGGTPSNTLVVIHEICHAVSSTHHGRAFQARLATATEVASRLGAKEVHDLLQQEIAMCQDVSKRFPLAAFVYEEAERAGAVPGAIFGGVLRWLAGDAGLTPAELRRRFPRLRAVFMEARKMARSASRDTSWPTLGGTDTR